MRDYGPNHPKNGGPDNCSGHWNMNMSNINRKQESGIDTQL